VLDLQGQLLLATKKEAAARKVFARMIELAPKNPLGYVRRGLLYKRQRQYDQALKDLRQALALEPRLNKVAAEIVTIYMLEKKPDQAEAFCRERQRQYPENAYYDQLLGRVYLSQRQLDKAEKAFSTAIEKDKNLLSAYVFLAAIYRRQGNVAAAEKKYEEMIAARPRALAPYMLLGLLREQRGKTAQAIEAYEQALKIKEDFFPAMNNLAWLLVEHGGDLERARELAEGAKRLQPEDPRITDTLGWVYYKKNELAKALVYLREAADKLADDPQVNYHLGMALVSSGDRLQGSRYLRRALEIDKNFPGAREAEKVLAQKGES